MPLCASFAAEMRTPENRKIYDSLAKKAVDDIQNTFRKSSRQMLSGRNTILAKQSQQPDSTNLELLTWLVIKHTTDGN